MDSLIIHSVQENLKAQAQLQTEQSISFIKDTALMIANCFKNKGKVIIAGNGGSLCDAMHFAEELTGQFRKRRPALPAIALADSSHITCVANDMGFDEVFARGVEAYGQPGDIFIGLTTSGNSTNMIKAFKLAKIRSMSTIAFLGKKGGLIKGTCDLEFIVEGDYHSDRIQEVHMTAIHIIIQAIEYELFGTR